MRIYAAALPGALIFGLGGAIPAMAQAQPAGDAAQPPARGYIEEVIVTGQKRAEDMQSVPIAITAFGEESIKAQQITDITTLPQVVPGLSMPVFRAIPHYVIRGLGQRSNTPAVEQAVSLYVDGVYMPFPVSGLMKFNNISKIEINKGPQGTLFGRNALGGVVLVDTKTPGREFEGSVEVGYGNYDTRSGGLYMGGPITDTISADIALHGEHQLDGWGKNLWDLSDNHKGFEYAARTKWVYEPSDATRLTFIADYNLHRSNAAEPAMAPGVFPGLDYGQPHLGGFYDTYQPKPDISTFRQWGFSLRGEQDLGWAELQSITAWRNNRFPRQAWQPVAPFPYGPIGGKVFPTSGYTISDALWGDDHASQEINLFSPASSPITWTTGVFLYWDKAYQSPNNGGRVYARQITKSYAVFGQATVPLRETTRLTVGARYTIDDRHITGVTYTPTGAVNETHLDNPQRQKTWREPTYKVAIDHDLTENAFVYGSYTRGFQSGYYTLGSPADPPVNPAIIDAFEVGLKADLFDGRLRLNGSAFHYEMKDLVVTRFILVTPTQPVGLLENAARAEYDGFDIEATFAPVRNLTAKLAYAYVNPRFTDYPNAQFFRPGTNGRSWQTFIGDATGNQIDNTEKKQVTGSIRYVWNTSFGDVSAAADFAYHSGMVFDVQNMLKQPSYTLYNATLNWTSPSETWEVLLWGRNLGGEKYVSNVLLTAANASMQAAPPRTYGITLTRHW